MTVQQRVYEWVLILGDDIVVAKGEKHAPNDEQLEGFIEGVLMKKYPTAGRYSYKQLYCDDCGEGENDVTAYYYPNNDQRVVKCFDCRHKHFLSRNYGTVKKGDIGL